MSVKIPPIVFRKFEPGPRPPKDKRDTHFMLPGGREGVDGANREVTSGWNKRPSVRYAKILGSEDRATQTPTQSPYLVHVRPELRGWSRGVSTIHEIEGALLPLKTKRPVPDTELNIELDQVNKEQTGLDFEVTFLAVQEFETEGEESMVPPYLRFMPIPLRIHSNRVRVVDYDSMKRASINPRTGDYVPYLGQSLQTIFPEGGGMNIQGTVVANALRNLNIRGGNERERISNIRESVWYQEYVGVEGRVTGAPTDIKLEREGGEVVKGANIFIPYSFIIRLRQVYPKNVEYPNRVSAEPTSGYINDLGLDVPFIKRWGPEFYHLIIHQGMTPNQAIAHLRGRR